MGRSRIAMLLYEIELLPSADECAEATETRKKEQHRAGLGNGSDRSVVQLERVLLAVVEPVVHRPILTLHAGGRCISAGRLPVDFVSAGKISVNIYVQSEVVEVPAVREILPVPNV